MSLTTSTREETIELMRGPAIEVMVISPSDEDDTATWSIPKALLSHHSRYFERAERLDYCLESEEGKATLDDFEPHIFKLFVEFIYFGEYTCPNDLSNSFEVRDSAKAWVLGDYLDAIEFQNCAMRNLYSIYFPPFDVAPRLGVGPKLIEYCCSNVPADSNLVRFFKDVLITYWDDINVTRYLGHLRDEWEAIWEKNPQFRNDILYSTSRTLEARAEVHGPIEDYIEKPRVI